MDWFDIVKNIFCIIGFAVSVLGLAVFALAKWVDLESSRWYR